MSLSMRLDDVSLLMNLERVVVNCRSVHAVRFFVWSGPALGPRAAHWGPNQMINHAHPGEMPPREQAAARTPAIVRVNTIVVLWKTLPRFAVMPPALRALAGTPSPNLNCKEFVLANRTGLARPSLSRRARPRKFTSRPPGEKTRMSDNYSKSVCVIVAGIEPSREARIINLLRFFPMNLLCYS